MADFEEFFNGPNQVIKSESFTTIQRNGRVKLRIPASGTSIETYKPISVPGFFMKAAENFACLPAYAFKVNGKWVKRTYKEYLEEVRTCAKAFLHLGLERYHSVCILGFNSPEWFISNIAAIFAGGFATGIYTTNSSDACHHVAEVSKANIIVVEDQIQLDKILEIKSKLPHLKAIIQYSGKPTSPDVLSWEQVMKIGKEQSDFELDKVLQTIAVNECCTLIFTSGTVGKPKAVMLSHDNLTYDALVISERLHIKPGSEVLISYLPLSHVAAQMIDIYLAIHNGCTVYFADKNALKGSLVVTLQEVQPTKFLAVPRVWEKIYERIMQVREQAGPIKRAISTWCRGHALQHHLDNINGKKTNTWSYSIASNLVLSKIKQALGFSRCDLFASAAAPLSSEIKKYFLSLDIPIMEVFGMSEVSGGHTVSLPSSYNIDSIGMTLPGTKTKLYNVESESGQGELCLYGRHIFMGYLNDKEKTEDTIDTEGWLHTGDLGKIDEKGFVYITGRLKELIITAGGENVAPVPIEQLIISELPQISNAFLVGEKKKFLSVLLSFKTDLDSEGKPTDTLLPSVQSWLSQVGCPATTVTEVLNSGPDSRIMAALQEGINNVNKHAISNAQKIQKIAILPADFSIQTGELGPTLKVRRNVVADKYNDIIEKLYM